jgi:HEAT repeat protein
MAAELDKAFDTLKTYDWGMDGNLLNPINDAIIASHGDAAATTELESRLAAVLKTAAPRDAKDFVCRKLALIGTAASVPVLAEFLPDKDNSHMARYALERIPAPEAAEALRSALEKVGGALKIGMISSLGSRRDVASVPAIAALLGDADSAIAIAAAHALGDIGNKEAATALAKVLKSAPAAVKPAVADASLVCAEQLLAQGDKASAIAVYKSLGGSDQPKHVRLAAKQGLIAAIKK